MNDEIIKEFERYLNRCYTRRSAARHYAHHVNLFFHRCQRPIAELTRQDVDSYVVNELARRLNKAAISRRLASLRHLR
jgi:site-specific recombinase XerD